MLTVHGFLEKQKYDAKSLPRSWQSYATIPTRAFTELSTGIGQRHPTSASENARGVDVGHCRDLPLTQEQRMHEKILRNPIISRELQANQAPLTRGKILTPPRRMQMACQERVPLWIRDRNSSCLWRMQHALLTAGYVDVNRMQRGREKIGKLATTMSGFEDQFFAVGV